MDPIALLKQEHEQVRQLLSRLAEAGEDERAEGLRELARMLAIHTAGEEDVVYPLLRDQADVEEDQIDEAYAEHQEVDVLIDSMREVIGDDEAWQGKIEELRQAIEHHVEEEETELLPQLGNLDTDAVDQIADDMEDVRSEMSDWLEAHPEATAQQAAEALTNGFES